MKIGAAPPELVAEYPPAYPDLWESLADIADFVHLAEHEDGSLTITAEREPEGHASYTARVNVPNIVVAWNRLGGLRQLIRGLLNGFEKADGIVWRYG